jgi:hypothetical protein
VIASPQNDHERDTPMTGTYIAVVVVEAIVIALLFLLGRIYS